MMEQASSQLPAGSSPAALASPSRNANAEIVTARKISHTKAPVVTHYLTHSKSGSVELRRQSPSPQEMAAGVNGPPRILPSPVPPPSSALPPTPAGAFPSIGASYRGSGSSFATSTTSTTAASAPSILAKSIRKTFRHLSAGLTPEEHSELVQKILADLRPATRSTVVKPFSRASRPSNIVVSSPSPPRAKAASAKMVLSKSGGLEEVGDAAGKRLRASSTVSNDVASSGDEKKSASDSATQLSQSRTPTPTTPASPTVSSADSKATETNVVGEKDVLTPTAALESLRVLEQSFNRTNRNSPLDADFTKDSKLSQTTTAVASSPTKSETRSNGTASPTKVKRNSSYRKSVPPLEQLDASKKGLGIDSSGGGSSAASSERASSPSSVTTETPSWISSLTTLEAIRVLAFQQANGEQPRSPTVPEEGAAEVGATSSDEVSALRYALNFTLARADKLAEALNRVSEDKIKVETELEILRRNVLSMLGSENMFSAGTPSPPQPQLHGDGILEEEDGEVFEDAMAKQTPVQSERVLPASRRSSAASSAVTRPPRVARAAKPSTPPSKPSGGVSIASLRKKNPSLNTTSDSSAQRYAPPTRKASTTTDDAYETEEEEDDDEFDMYPFGAPVRRNPLPEVSMTDFLNASRMSKSEIAEHDARRELEREEDGPGYSASSTSSHAPLAGSSSMRSLDAHRRGFFKGITKLVDQERAKRNSRRQSLVSKPSMSSLVAPSIATGMSRSLSTNNIQARGGFSMAYQEESIIPSYPGTEGRNYKALSMSNSLRESLERQSLREAGIRTRG